MSGEILFTTFEAVKVAQGDSMVMRDSNGDEVLCRLATPEEFLKLQAEASVRIAKMMGDGWEPPPSPTLQRAEELTKPLPS